jgi:predicted DNA-binding antitoxin AbrB/MazE fold protein
VLAPRKPVQLDEGARVRLGKRVFTVSVVIGGEGG